MLQASELTVFFSGISKHPKLSTLNGTFLRLPLYFSRKFTIQNIEEELQICFILRTATKLKKPMEPTHCKVALGQPHFHVPEGLEMAVSRNFPRKIYFNLKISISWLEPLTKFTCKIWAKSVNLPVRRFSIWLHFYGVSLLRANPRKMRVFLVWKRTVINNPTSNFFWWTVFMTIIKWALKSFLNTMWSRDNRFKFEPLGTNFPLLIFPKIGELSDSLALLRWKNIHLLLRVSVTAEK